ncbi:hypothetical protein [Pantoea conspicua]|uniref:hypothetical protein n=1 Tax=Pantoea conspicua TaxID=472705 RepID=UPI00130204A2|nr:hypothetical protein [Pantoea conspicua]
MQVNRADRSKLINTIARMVGDMVQSRACPGNDPLADEIFEVCQKRILNQP